jgi:hypothetical protein
LVEGGAGNGHETTVFLTEVWSSIRSLKTPINCGIGYRICHIKGHVN